jgi:integrase
MATRSRHLNRLTRRKVETAATKGGKPLHDGGGLYFVPKPIVESAGKSGGVTPSGWWKFKFIRPRAYGGGETSLSFGQYPDVDLDHARGQREGARKDLARGIDPGAKRKTEATAAANSFKSVATQWLAAGCPGGKKRSDGISAETINQLTARLENHVFPYIGTLPITSVKIENARGILDRLETDGKTVLASHIRSLGDRVFRFAVAKQLADTNPFAALTGTIARTRTKHYAAITEAKAFGALLRAIDGYQGQPATKVAMQLLALLFPRPSELRLASWGEFDLDAKEPQWVVPLERTKMRRPHVVPLPTQAIAILNWLRPLTHRGPESWVLPSLRPQKPLSENTVNAALRSLGYGTNDHVGHGFRSSASTLLHELGHSSDVIEIQLAHAIPGVKGIYNRSHLLPQRRELMAAWADYCDALKDTKANVTLIRA